MQTLILIRHGETRKNVERRLHAHEDPELLTERGIEQMKKTAARLKEFSPAKIYASGKARAAQSGQLIARELGVPFETIGGMRERNWGEFSGKPWSEVERFLNRMTLNERYAYIPPGGESWQEFEMRLISAVRSLLARHPDETVAVISHGGAIRALMPFLLGVSKEESFKYNPDNASLTVFSRDDNGALRRIVINDVSHLS